MKLFSLYDSKAATFANPYCVQTEALAIRAVLEMLTSQDARVQDLPPCKYPADFSLFCLGDFDESTGKIESDLHCVENLLVLKTQYELRQEEVSKEIVKSVKGSK